MCVCMQVTINVYSFIYRSFYKKNRINIEKVFKIIKVKGPNLILRFFEREKKKGKWLGMTKDALRQSHN